MRWLVTGGAGFIGSHFIGQALAADPGLEIVNLDVLTYAGRRENLAGLPGRHRLVHGDVAAAADVAAAFAACGSAPAAVVHFAAETHVDRSIADAAAFLRTNVLGTQVLLDGARAAGAARFLHVSTDEIYGSLGPEGRFDEAGPLAPNSPYAASKAAAECLVRAAWRTHGVPAIVVRPSNNYGPRQFPEKFIPLAIHRALANQPVPLYGKGEQVRNWIHVADTCRGILAALEHGAPGQAYNLGGASELSNRALLEQLLGLLQRPVDLIRLVPDRPGHDFRYALDSSRAARELQWRPQIALADGLQQTVDWYRDHPEWMAAVTGPAYRQYLAGQYGTAL